VNKAVQQALTPLIRLPLRAVGRSGSMLSVEFGDMHEVSTPEGGSKSVREWTIQIQCPWRISQSGRIVVAYRDFYFSDVPLDNVAVMNKSRFDSTLLHLCAEFDAIPPVVTSVDTDETGGFSVNMSLGYRLEVFPAESMESGKHWRIYQPGILGKSFVFPPDEA